MAEIKFYTGKSLPLEMHKVCVVQATRIPPIEERAAAIRRVGFNSYRLTTDDLYLDMLTDSGVNAMSNMQLSAMMQADDCYAGSSTFKRFESKINDIFNKKYVLPVHQGRACENILAQGLIRQGNAVPMNFFFGTILNQIKLNGGYPVTLISDEGLLRQSDNPFKGNFDLAKLDSFLAKESANTAFVRIEAGTNLIGGQPISLENIVEASKLCKKYGVLSVLDASLLQDNLYFIKKRECPEKTVRQITREISDAMDIVYFSARKLGFGRGGAICLNNPDIFRKLELLVSRFEGFPTYGGMSVREMEAIVVGLDETMDMNIISQGPEMIRYLCERFIENNVPVVTPPGGLGCHIDAKLFAPHLPMQEYPAGSVAAAIYLASGARGMERGGIDEPWENPNEPPFGAMELVRLAVPRRVYTVSQLNYLVDRVTWLQHNSKLIGGIKFKNDNQKNFYDHLEEAYPWVDGLVAKFRQDFGDSL